MEKYQIRMSGDYQEKVRSFVGSEVAACVSHLISELLQKAEYFPEYQDDLYSLCYAPEEEEGYEDEQREVFEHWIVSDWLADKLAEKGESVCKDLLGLTVWGRTTTGQAIYVDNVICDIYDETRG